MYKKFKIEEASNYQTVTSNLKYRIICKTKKEQKNPQKPTKQKNPKKMKHVKKKKTNKQNKTKKQKQKTSNVDSHLCIRWTFSIHSVLKCVVHRYYTASNYC